jgi:prepilin-type N-terminal cleavage/methylation domain-containing protein
MHKRKGFTLFELIIALSIISILSLIALPNFNKIQNKAKFITAQTNLSLFQHCLEEYFLETGEYPANTLDASALVTFLNSKDLLGSTPINPYTNLPYTAADSKGKIIYLPTAIDSYILDLYDRNGVAIIFSLKNI